MLRLCNISGKMKLATTVFVVAFSYAESKEEAPRVAGLYLWLFGNRFQAINECFITSIGT